MGESDASTWSADGGARRGYDKCTYHKQARRGARRGGPADDALLLYRVRVGAHGGRAGSYGLCGVGSLVCVCVCCLWVP